MIKTKLNVIDWEIL